MSDDTTTRAPQPVAAANDFGLEKMSRDSVSMEVSRRLLRYLLSGQVKVGDRLPSERQLAEQLDVGRNAIRDGLRPLTLLGILEARAGSGTYLKAPTSSLLPDVLEWGLLLGERSLKDLMDTRHVVEIGLAKLAAERRTDADVDVLRAAAKKLEVAANQDRRDKFLEADVAFHLQLSEAAQNDVLAGILRSTRTLMEAWIRSGLPPEVALPPLVEEHFAILRGIERGDAKAAGAAMDVHLRQSMKRLNGALDASRAASSEGV